jgi:hypothetical protein
MTGWNLKVDVPVNGRLGKATVRALLDDKMKFTDEANLGQDRERKRLAKELAGLMGMTVEELKKLLLNAHLDALARRDEEQAKRQSSAPASGSGATVELLDAAPDVIRRPLSLVGDHAYAASWLHAQRTVSQKVDDAGAIVTYDPPRVETSHVLVVVRDDGQAFTDTTVPDARPLAELGVEVRLPSPVPSRSGWSGAGVKRFLKGERPDVADVFRRVTFVVDYHIDFGRSLADQTSMCELVACYVLGSYLLDAFDVVGYLWPNGDKGTGKTHFLAVLTELAYLGQLILAGGSYASLRDLADCGATLAFDDAEGIMDVRKADPDKRALLLAGNRRGATVTVKELEGERWVTRFIHTFCPRAFSAIRLPDDVLASRTITIPLVRSSDAGRARSEPLDHAKWPCDRRRLVDDLWAVGLTCLPVLREYDTRAAEQSGMVGRELEPWRSILGVALWLEECHGVAGLFGRMSLLAMNYRAERCDLEVTDPVRVAIQALRTMARATTWVGNFTPTELADTMKGIAEKEELAEPGKDFTTARKVGWMLKRLRFRRVDRSERAKCWSIDAEELQSLARAYGMA